MSSKLRIGILCHPTYGGSGVVASELAISLAQAGHDVHLFSNDGGGWQPAGFIEKPAANQDRLWGLGLLFAEGHLFVSSPGEGPGSFPVVYTPRATTRQS